MFRHAALLLIIAVTTSGCDRITGVADQKIYDAEAIGYACRVSLKTPEDCMKENDAHSPSSVLSGWKSADKDIVDEKLDPSMGQNPAIADSAPPASAPAATADAHSAAPGKEAASGKQPNKPH